MWMIRNWQILPSGRKEMSKIKHITKYCYLNFNQTWPATSEPRTYLFNRWMLYTFVRSITQTTILRSVRRCSWFTQTSTICQSVSLAQRCFWYIKLKSSTSKAHVPSCRYTSLNNEISDKWQSTYEEYSENMAFATERQSRTVNLGLQSTTFHERLR